MTRLGRYLSPDHYKSRYNLYAGDVERTPSLSTDFMQPNRVNIYICGFSLKQNLPSKIVLILANQLYRVA